MSNVRTITVRTDNSGDFTNERALRGRILAIEVQLGEGGTALSTPDIDITDDTYSTSFLSVDGLASDTVYLPGAALQDDAGDPLEIDGNPGISTAAVCMGVLKVVVAGGGSNKIGHIKVLYD